MDTKPMPVHNKYYSNFIFLEYSLNNINFTLNPKFIYDEPVEVDFSLKKNISIKDKAVGAGNKEVDTDEMMKEATVSIECSVFEDAEQQNLPFTLHIKISGEFRFGGNADTKEFERYCEVNGVATLLPYLRAAITNITSLANIQPLVLPLINVYDFFEGEECISD